MFPGRLYSSSLDRGEPAVHPASSLPELVGSGPTCCTGKQPAQPSYGARVLREAKAPLLLMIFDKFVLQPLAAWLFWSVAVKPSRTACGAWLSSLVQQPSRQFFLHGAAESRLGVAAALPRHFGFSFRAEQALIKAHGAFTRRRTGWHCSCPTVPSDGPQQDTSHPQYVYTGT